LKSIIAIFVGGGKGSLLRWRLGLTLNSYFPSIPPGTPCTVAARHRKGVENPLGGMRRAIPAKQQ
jgi:hypothetical protein